MVEGDVDVVVKARETKTSTKRHMKVAQRLQVQNKTCKGDITMNTITL